MTALILVKRHNVCGLITDSKIHATIEHLHWTGRIWTNVKVEDLCRQIKRGAGIGNIHDTTDTSLNRCGTENRVGLSTREL